MTPLSCFNYGAKERQESHSFPPTVYFFALRLKKICLPFAPTFFVFHFFMTTICLNGRGEGDLRKMESIWT